MRPRTDEKLWWKRWLGLALAICLISPIGCKKDDDDKPPPLSTIRLFLVDDSREWIVQLNPHTGVMVNFFPVPTQQVSSYGVALAYNAGARILYFLDPSEPDGIYRILPDRSGPGTVDAVALQEPAFFPYDGFGYDGQWLLALDSQVDIIDALDPGTGAIAYSTSYCVDPMDPPNCADLEGGLDASLWQGIFAAGIDGGSGEKVIYSLDSLGAILDVTMFPPGFDPQGIAIAGRYIFISDVFNREIGIYSISRQDGQITLNGVKTLKLKEDLGFPDDATVTALAAG